MTKILAIGNSFSQDATRYLHDISACGGIDTRVVNLCIGGCSLSRHWENAENNNEYYGYEVNGEDTGSKVSIKQALLEDEWDFITMQQVSNESGILGTYYPYITKLSEYIKGFSPNSTQLIHQTWAYETDSDHEGFANYNNDQAAMFGSLCSAYDKVSSELNLGLIPCGEVIQRLRETPEFDCANGGKPLCRDGFHMHLIWGRFAVASVWYETILRGNILRNDFTPPGVGDDQRALHAIKRVVHEVCTSR